MHKNKYNGETHFHRWLNQIQKDSKPQCQVPDQVICVIKEKLTENQESASIENIQKHLFPDKIFSRQEMMEIYRQISSQEEEKVKHKPGDCPICLEDKIELILIDPCEHGFCQACLNQLTRKPQTCPLCRQPFSIPETDEIHNPHVLTEAQLQELMKQYKIVERVCKPQSFCTPYLVYKLAETLGILTPGAHGDLLPKNMVQLAKWDAMWYKVCQQNNWKFTPETI